MYNGEFKISVIGTGYWTWLDMFGWRK